MSRPGVNAEYGTAEYMQQALYSDSYTPAEKLSLIRKIDQGIQANIDRAVEDLYANQTFVKRADTNDDERFVEELMRQKDELITKLKDQVFNGKNRESRFGHLPTDEVTALMALATIDSLDSILDTSNGFLTGLEDGGARNINEASGRSVAVADIITRYKSSSTNYKRNLAA